MRELEQSGNLNEEYEKVKKEAQSISERLKNFHIIEDEVLIKKD